MKMTVEPPMADAMDAEILKLGEASSQMKDVLYETAAPSGVYTTSGLNSLVDALNVVLPMFGIPDYEKFSEVVTVLPGEFIKMLTMVNEAVMAAGLDEAVIDIGTLVDDKSLKMAAGKLMTLSSNSTFKAFLRSSTEKGAPVPPPEADAEEPMMPSVMSDTSADSLMMGRI